MNLGLIIAKIRISKGIKQIFVSQKTGISQAKLSLAEKGKRKLSNEEFSAICKVLNMDTKTIVKCILNSIESNDIKNGKKQAFKQIKPDLSTLLEVLISEL